MSAGNRPLIGVTCSTNVLERTPGDALLDRLGQAYASAVAEAGGAPVLVPNVGDAAALAGAVGRLDGLLLSGGYDVAPVLFGEDVLNATVEVDEPRDRAELPLVGEAVRRDLPVLAICRGIQALNVALGGTLWQDLPAQRPSAVRHRQSEGRSVATHDVAVTAGSRLREIAGADRIAVNSFHHQAVRRLADGLVVSGVADDGVVEAVEGVGARFLLGVQFHPEEMTAVSRPALRLFEAFVAAARG